MNKFDYVNVVIACPKCGNAVSEFRSTEFLCNEDRIDPTFVDNFYSSCATCGNLIEFDRSPFPKMKEARKTPYSIDDVTEIGFKMTKGF